MTTSSKKKRFRSVFISDIHLGTRHTKAALLSEFLNNSQFENIYLVGDIVDVWRLSKRWYWPKTHTVVIDKIVRAYQYGSRVMYVPGNHDEIFRKGQPLNNPGISASPFKRLFEISWLTNECVHEGLNGKKYLIIHGDMFDPVVTKVKWLAHAGDVAYDALLALNSSLYKVRKAFGLQYWSLSGWAKVKVKSVVNFVGDYETSLSKYAVKKEVDGIICGHIHYPRITKYGNMEYMNCGDMIDSCSVLVENVDGSFEILRLRS